jgi:hypothetical protein
LSLHFDVVLPDNWVGHVLLVYLQTLN